MRSGRYADGMDNPIGAILAGGGASRMGRDKAVVHFRGRTLLDHVAAALDASGLDVVVVGRDHPIGGYTAVPDVSGLGGGPAVGLLSVFAHHPNRDVFLAAVDQPLLRAETVRKMLDVSGDAVVPVADSHPQVTCALYRATCHSALEGMLRTGQSKLRRLLDAINPTLIGVEIWSKWGEDGSSWLSLDTPEALRAAEALP